MKVLEQIEMKYNQKSTKVLRRHGKQHEFHIHLQYADPKTLKQLENENLDDEAREALLQQAEHQHQQELRRRKREAVEKKLKSIDKGGSMAPGALMELMKDENLVERYSKHVIAILFSYQDEFMKSKYSQYMETVEPSNQISFFERMKKDKAGREERERQRQERAERRQTKSKGAGGCNEG